MIFKPQACRRSIGEVTDNYFSTKQSSVADFPSSSEADGCSPSDAVGANDYETSRR